MWLCRIKKLHFLSLSETKMAFGDVERKLNFLSPSSSFGCNSEGSRGGLVGISWYDAVVNNLFASPNVVACNVLESNEKIAI